MIHKRQYGLGFNESDERVLDAVRAELDAAWASAQTQRQAMEHLLFAKHLLEKLLRQMQDN